MVNKDITVKRVEELKTHLEEAIKTMIIDFQETSGLTIEGIEIDCLNLSFIEGRAKTEINNVNLVIKW